jgi:hypothetical protein
MHALCNRPPRAASPRNLGCLGLAVLWLGLGSGTEPVRGADAAPQSATLTQAEQDLLPHMDERTVEECVRMAEQVNKWRARVKAIREQAEKRRASGVDLVAPAAGATITLVTEIMEAAKKLSPSLRERLTFVDKMEAKLRAAERAWREARFDPEEYFDLDEATFRKELKQRVTAAAAYDIIKNIDAELFGAVEALKNPARFARGFLENEIKKRFLNKPYTAGDAKEVRFVLTQKDFGKSLFSPDANLALEIEYAPNGLKVKATGLYFRYRRNQLPLPVFDKVKVESSALEDLVKNLTLSHLGDALPDLGLPIQIKSPRMTDFGPQNGDRAGTLSFRLLIELSKLGDVGLDKLPALQADVTITRYGQITLDAIKQTIPVNPPVPLGSTGLFFESGSVELRPKEKTETVTIGAIVSTAAGGSATLSLDLKIKFGFPITRTGVKYSGRLMVGKQTSLGEVWGEITKEHVTINVKSTVPGEGMRLTAKGEINKAGLTADAHLEALLGIARADADLFIGTNGHGHFSISEKVDIGDVARAEVSFAGRFTPGFKSVTLNGSLCVAVQDDLLGWIQASVEAEAEVAPKPRIIGRAVVGDLVIAFEVKDFNGLYKELQRALLKQRDQLYNTLAQAEKAAGKYGAEREEALRNWVYQNAQNAHLDHVSIDGGGPIDSFLGQKSEQLKAAGRTWTNWRDWTGKGLADTREQAEAGAAHAEKQTQDILSHPVESASGVIQNPSKIWGGGSLKYGLTDSTPPTPRGVGPVRVGKVGGVHGGFELFGGDIETDLKEAVEKSQRRLGEAAAHARVNALLDKLLNEMERQTIHKSQHGRKGDASELRVRIDRSLAHPEGDRDAVITFTIQASSVRQHLDLHAREAARPTTASDIRVGQIRLRGLYGKGKPQIDVIIPKLRHVSLWNPEQLLRDRVSDLVERLLPAGSLSGRFEERKLAVRNSTGEPIHVRVQVEGKAGQGGWKWLPAGPGVGKDTYVFVVPPGKTVALHAGPQGAVLAGRRARLWAESESGRAWAKNLNADVLLVDEKDEEGQARYYGDTMEFFVYNFTAPRGPRLLRERAVEVRNDTHVPLLVNARALSRDPDGKPDWDATGKPTKVEPGKTVRLHQANGWSLRGSEVRLWAEDEKGEALRWMRFRNASTAQVPREGYKGEALAATLFVLEPAARKGTDPAAGGTTVHLPADQVMARSMKGKSLQEAKEALEGLGLKVSHDPAPSQTKVTSQKPEPGWRTPGDTVTLIAGSAKVVVPDFSKLTEDEAKAEGKKLGLDVRFSVATEATRKAELVGKTVFESQSVAKGGLVNGGATVTIKLKRYIAAK